MAFQYRSHHQPRTIGSTNDFNATAGSRIGATQFGTGCESTELSRKSSTLRRIVIPAAILDSGFLESPDTSKDSVRRIGSPGDHQNSNRDISGRQNIFRHQNCNRPKTSGPRVLRILTAFRHFSHLRLFPRMPAIEVFRCKNTRIRARGVTFEAGFQTPRIRDPPA